jgi:ltrF
MSNRINRTRQKRREVCLTEEENELLKKRINDSPYDNFQNYARHMLLAGAIHYVDYSELQQLKWEVNKIGNNINQIAKLANQFEEISQEDIDDLLDLIHQVEWLVSNKLKDEISKERKTNGIHETF